MPSPQLGNTVLAKAVVRASTALGLDMGSLALVLGHSFAEDIQAGIPPESVCGQRALLFVRAYRALSSLTGHDQTWMRAWMMTENDGLKGIPATLIRSAAGLGRVTDYLEGLESLSTNNGS